MATFSGLLPARDIWLLQKFTQCHLATEKTSRDRVCVLPMIFGERVWAIDGGNVRHGWLDYELASAVTRWRSEYNKNGLRHGVIETWYGTGEIRHRENFKDGKKHGLCERWYVSGQRHWAVNYHNGIHHGLSEGWGLTGHRSWHINYKDGQRHGSYVTWNEETGKLACNETYENGKRVS